MAGTPRPATVPILLRTMIEVIHPGLLSSIQESGRKGLTTWAIPQSGVLDREAFTAANALLGNPPNTPVVEVNLLGPKLLFHEATHLVLTGADLNWQLNGAPVDRYRPIPVQSGDTLVGKFAVNGARAYLAIAGGFQATRSLGSAATYPPCNWGGLNDAYLKKGDTLFFANELTSDPVSPSEVVVPDYSAYQEVRCYPGPDWHLLNETSKAAFRNHPFSISQQSNRMGAVLENNTLSLVSSPNLPSAAIFPGIIQLPPSGNPIVLLQDCQTTGGYPRIAYIPEKELMKFTQIMPGRTVKFAFLPENRFF
ncbi:MAG: biotin-dependent carboxyltransferase family protein [Bacteroidota bacterium]